MDSFGAGGSELPQHFLCGVDIESRGREAGGALFHEFAFSFGSGAGGVSFVDSRSLVDRKWSSSGEGSLAGRGQTLSCDAGFGRAVYVFVESCGERSGIVEERERAANGGICNGKGQTKKIPKTPRTPKVKQKRNLHIYCMNRPAENGDAFGFRDNHRSSQLSIVR